MSAADTTTKTAKHDWNRFDSMTDTEVHEAATNDPDARPLTDEEWARVKRVPRSKTLRRALGLTQEEFALRYHIPLGTLRDWEQERCEPDQTARAYLTAIAHDPDGVRHAGASMPTGMMEIGVPFRSEAVFSNGRIAAKLTKMANAFLETVRAMNIPVGRELDGHARLWVAAQIHGCADSGDDEFVSFLTALDMVAGGATKLQELAGVPECDRVAKPYVSKNAFTDVTGDPVYRLPFKMKSTVDHWVGEYWKTDKTAKVGDKAALHAGSRILAGEYLTEHLMTIYRWKLANSLRRKLPHVRDFPGALERTDIEALLWNFANAVDDDRARNVMAKITSDHIGIGMPTASVFLTMIHPSKFTVIDVLATRALQNEQKSPTVSKYFHYLAFCRDTAATLGVSLRDLDRALWQYGSEMTAY